MPRIKNMSVTKLFPMLRQYIPLSKNSVSLDGRGLIFNLSDQYLSDSKRFQGRDISET